MQLANCILRKRLSHNNINHNTYEHTGNKSAEGPKLLECAQE